MQIKVIMAKITNGNCRLMYCCYINFAAQNHSEVNNLWEIGKKRGKKLWKHEFSEIYELSKNSQCMVRLFTTTCISTIYLVSWYRQIYIMWMVYYVIVDTTRNHVLLLISRSCIH